jgi:hypothetical protein
MTLRRIFATALLLGSAARAGAQSCAMCGSFGTNEPLQRAFSWSVIFLMATPYTIVGTVAAWLFFTYRRAGRRRRAEVIELGRARRAEGVEA